MLTRCCLQGLPREPDAVWLEKQHVQQFVQLDCIPALDEKASVTKHVCMKANFAQLDRQKFRLVKVQGHTSAG